jgi:transcriptional regulator with XRE-family HTH domain
MNVLRTSAAGGECAAIGRLLRAYRERAGLSQADLATMTGTTRSYVQSVERGERRMDLVQLRSACKTMGVSLDQFAESLDRLIARA